MVSTFFVRQFYFGALLFPEFRRSCVIYPIIQTVEVKILAGAPAPNLEARVNINAQIKRTTNNNQQVVTKEGLSVEKEGSDDRKDT